jgi:hypothetical protein
MGMLNWVRMRKLGGYLSKLIFEDLSVYDSHFQCDSITENTFWRKFSE